MASVAGLLSGAQLKWDSLQLRAVRTGIDLEGFRWLLDRDTPVRAAEVGDEVMSLNELRAWTGGHIAMGVIALALVVGARWTRPQPRGGTVPWTTRRH